MAEARNSRIGGVALVLIAFFLIAFPAYAKYGGGTGEPNDPYQIATAEQLVFIGSDPNLLDKAFVLVADIDLDPNRPGGRVFNWAVIAADIDAAKAGFQGASFTGSFDGAGHTISNLTLSGGEQDYIALFGLIARSTGGSNATSGVVKNLHLVDEKVSGRHSVAGIAGGNYGAILSCTVTGSLSGDHYVGGVAADSQGDIESCQFSGQVTGRMQVGGIVGYNKASIISCFTQGTVQGGSSVGGLVGDNSGPYPGNLIQDCQSQTDVLGKGCVGGLFGYGCGRIVSSSSSGHITGTDSVGGLVGKICRGGTLSMCHSTADVVSTGYNVGGLVGLNDGANVEHCFASGQVEGQSAVGGLVGNNGEDDSLVGWEHRSRVESCYARGDTKGNSQVGGLVGYHRRGVIDACYSTGQVAGGTSTGGLIGKRERVLVSVRLSYWDRQTSGQSISEGGHAKSTPELMTPDTFMGWGDGVWRIDPGRDYPRLAWEGTAGQLITEAPATYGGGNGTPSNPYQIWTPDQLMVLAYHPEDYGRSFALMTDLDMAAMDPNRVVPIGMNLVPFLGVFEGNGHSISNLTYVGENDDYVGLFGCVGAMFWPANDRDGIIRNLHMTNANVLGNTCTGGIAGLSTGTVMRCSLTGTIQGKENVGALVGQNGGIVEQSWADATVIGGVNTGGLVGYHRQVDEYLPGLIRQCCSRGQVRAESGAGGLVGISYGWIESCYSSARVDGRGPIGGLIGIQDKWGCIIRCYSAGFVGTAQGGGLLGAGSASTAFQCFWDNETSGALYSAAGYGRPTAQMFTAETFDGWGPGGDWTIQEGQGYPRLACENAPGTPIVGSAYTYGGGSGEPNDPFQLWTAEQLASIADHYEDFNSCIVLMADVDLNDVDPERVRPIGTYYLPFTGVFHGNGHTIANFRFEQGDEDCVGLFGTVGSPRFDEASCKGTVSNVCLDHVAISGGNCVGAVAGACYGGSLIACSAAGRVTGGCDVGGLVGYGFWATIQSGRTDGVVDGVTGVGGLAGRLVGSSVTLSKAQCLVSGHERLAGLVGKCDHYAEDGLLSQCAAGGSVRGQYVIGGLVGENDVVITDCYAAVDVKGEEYVIEGSSPAAGGGRGLSSQIGGLLGANSGLVMRSYAASPVAGDREVGGFLGHDGGAEYIGCFWDAQVAAATSGVGNLAVEPDGVFGRTTAEMETAPTFVSLAWDFVGETANGTEEIWWIEEGKDYPRLWWERGGEASK
jgi:hypothetical protein